MTPTSRTLKWIRDQGCTAAVVERWIPSPKHPAGGFRRDYLKIIDVIAISDAETIGIQSTTTAFQEHYRKITEEQAENARQWLSCKNRRLYLYGWRKVKLKRGSKAIRWRPRIVEILISDLQINPGIKKEI